MADPTSFAVPTPVRSLVLANIAVQASEEFVDTDDPAELARLAMRRTWAVTYASADAPGVITLPDQRVTEDDLPLLTALFEELLATDPAPPYDLDEVLGGAVQRLASVNAEDVAAE
jgi:hypothetical protein